MFAGATDGAGDSIQLVLRVFAKGCESACDQRRLKVVASHFRNILDVSISVGIGDGQELRLLGKEASCPPPNVIGNQACLSFFRRGHMVNHFRQKVFEGVESVSTRLAP